jgi:hypothetical protein
VTLTADVTALIARHHAGSDLEDSTVQGRFTFNGEGAGTYALSAFTVRPAIHVGPSSLTVAQALASESSGRFTYVVGPAVNTDRLEARSVLVLHSTGHRERVQLGGSLHERICGRSGTAVRECPNC